MAATPAPDLLARPETERECEICWESFIWLSVDFFWDFKELYPFKHRSPSISSQGGSSSQTSRIGGHPKRGGGRLAVIIYLRVTIFYPFFIDISKAVGVK